MSEYWARRQRSTNQLIRLIASHVFRRRSITPDQLYGLCKLTWITDSFSDDDAAYISSTKIPALGDVFGVDYAKSTLEDVAADVSKTLDLPEAEKLVLNHTGFTNFYKAYRNSARKWIDTNFDSIMPLFTTAYSLKTDQEGLELVQEIQKLPGLPKANHGNQLMQPQYLLTPVFFALDPRIRFPLINGNEGVKKLLSKLGVKSATLSKQYQSMIGLYGTGGIVDAADLDQVGRDLPDFVRLPGVSPTKQLLQEQPTEGNDLPLKDESDIESLQQARTIVSKRLHNCLTNKLKCCLSDYTLLEGCDKAAQFDVLVKNYNGEGDDLLIEAKSSTEIAHVRMAVGQLFAYWFSLKGDVDHHLAVLMPSEPMEEIKRLLEWLGIGILWFENDILQTCSDWLEEIVAEV